MSAPLVRRFVTLVCRLRLFADKLANARATLDVFRPDGLSIAEGERLFVKELDGLMTTVETRLDVLNEQIERAPAGESPDSLTRELEDMERLLRDWRWGLLDEIQERLRQKRAQQELTEKQFAAILKGFWEKLAPLPGLLEDARRFNAAVEREREAVKRINRIYEQASSSVRCWLAAAYEDMAVLAKETSLDGLATVVRSKMEHSKKIRRRADLLLLRTPLDAEKLQTYEALLRTASEPGVHGISLHATSTLEQQDRNELTRMTELVTQKIRAGGLRSAPPGAGAEAIRELAPIGSAAAPGQLSEDISLQSTCEFMYRLLMPEAVQLYLEGSTCSLTVTTNDLELPWELMHDGKEHLCLQRPTARMPMGTYLPQERGPVPLPDKPRFLLVHPSADLPGAAAEVEHIRAAFQDRVSIDVLGPEKATGRELNWRFRSGQYHIIHFAGHAQFDKDDPDKSGLLLANGERFLAQKARRLLRGRPFVFLNACQSGTAASAAPDAATSSYLQSPAAGLASAFVYGGALGCVGAIWPVYDDAASFLARELYDQLLDGAMIGEAMRSAREKTRAQFASQFTWAAFVLYGDPTFQLFA